MSGKSFTVLNVGAAANDAAVLRRALAEEGNDEQLIQDMIAGSSNLAETIAIVYAETIEQDALAEGLKITIDLLQRRLSRLETAAESRRRVICQAMERAEIESIKTPLATLSMRTLPPKVVLTDERRIPAEYWKPQEPKLDKRALLDDLKNGFKIDGAELSNGGQTLSVRVK